MITLEVDGLDRAGAWVKVANAGYPPREPASGGFTLMTGDMRHTFASSVQPEVLEGLPMLPVYETAAALGYQTAWDPENRTVTVTDGTTTATLNVDTGATEGLKWPLTARVVPRGDEYLVEWTFFTDLTGWNARYDPGSRKW